MFYLDDSGAGATGYVVFSWIECEISSWRSGLRNWLEFRKRLFADCRIPSDYELHATLFINGRGRPSADAAWNLNKANRIEAARQALDVIGRCTQLSVGTAYRRFAKPGQLGTAKAGLYQSLIQHLDHRLAASDELGLVLLDGDGHDRTFDAAHRALDLERRRIVEDPLFRASHGSQWIQMADLVAYAAYQRLLMHPAKGHLWDWYDRYLISRDLSGGPIEL